MPDNRTVLVVEDEEEILTFIEMLLGGEGYRVNKARDAEEGFRSIRQERPGVVLVDLTLPGMSGEEFIKRLRDEFGPGMPIVILSAGRDLDKIAAQVGADDSLAKPFDVDALVAKVDKWTKK